MRFPAGVVAHLPKLNLASLVLAAIFFVMPWSEIQCSGKLVATQSGVQSIYCGATLTPDLQKLVDQQKDTSTAEDEHLGPSYLAGAALALIALGAVSALVAMITGRTILDPGLLAGLALVLLLVQGWIGFPVDRWAEHAQATSAPKPGGDPMGMLFASAFSVTVARTNWYYLELFALAIPAAVLALRVIPDPRPQRGFDVVPEPSSPPSGEA